MVLQSILDEDGHDQDRRKTMAKAYLHLAVHLLTMSLTMTETKVQRILIKRWPEEYQNVVDPDPQVIIVYRTANI